MKVSNERKWKIVVDPARRTVICCLNLYIFMSYGGLMPHCFTIDTVDIDYRHSRHICTLQYLFLGAPVDDVRDLLAP